MITWTAHGTGIHVASCGDYVLLAWASGVWFLWDMARPAGRQLAARGNAADVDAAKRAAVEAWDTASLPFTR